ncbi:MAG: tryptophan 7-halogenase [Akkermansiaceae bacterium]|nr:tryptophan 7-halogenase [Akkermansiaceae bacterium]
MKSILVLGGGSAGLITALTFRRMLPEVSVKLVHSPDIGVIGVGEGTTAVFPEHFFKVLGLPKDEFYRETSPTWKQGIKFVWGPRDHFFYTFDFQYDQKRQGMGMANGFYADDDCGLLDLPAALMQCGKAFASGPLGKPLINGQYAFHIENKRLVAYLEKICAASGVAISEDTFVEAERTENGVGDLVFQSGARRSADLVIDASGFRSELIGRTLGVSFKDFSTGLFCDRAWIGGWTRGDEPLHAYTTAETMDSGWCWQIEHEDWINRGYVYSSRFINDDEALGEFLRKNPKVSNEPRLVRFRSGRHDSGWVGNVVAVGNSSGFVEPLEATALAQLIYEVRWLIEVLRTEQMDPAQSAKDRYNEIVGRAWDEIRDFLAYHYRFNTRLDTPFWKHCRNETSLGDYEGFYQEYRRLGPAPETIRALPYKPNIYGIEGYLAMLVGMKVPHERTYQPGAGEIDLWHRHQRAMRTRAAAGVASEKALAAIRSPHWSWS